MAKEKACIKCKKIYEGDACPNCGDKATSDNFKGRLFVFNPEESEVSQNMNIHQKGEFAVKTR